jgi:hypothetical protein
MDKFLNHEALHMAAVMSDMIAGYVLEHEAIANIPERAKLAEKSFNNMWELYQLIGREE